MRINAALETLSGERWDSDAAWDIVAAFASLPLFDPRTLEVRTSRYKAGTGISGLTELGIVRVGDETKKWQTVTRGIPTGEQEVCIGRFIVHRERHYDFCAIAWRDFRGDQPVMLGKPPMSRWLLGYFPKTGMPFRLDRLDPAQSEPGLRDFVRLYLSNLRHRTRFSLKCWEWVPITLYIELPGERF
jgi:hypothetical protein